MDGLTAVVTGGTRGIGQGVAAAFADEGANVTDTLRTNCRGVYTTIRESLPHLTENARVLVPTGSIGHETHAGYGSYAVSKAASEALVRGFSAELDGAVVGIDPGVVGTDMMGGKGRDPEDVAGLFVWAATGAAEVDGEIVGLKRWRQATRE
jgi:3-oxoacyl-[acyl-carrier protein] reductase